jgi:hypothetical protein
LTHLRIACSHDLNDRNRELIATYYGPKLLEFVAFGDFWLSMAKSGTFKLFTSLKKAYLFSESKIFRKFVDSLLSGLKNVKWQVILECGLNIKSAYRLKRLFGFV